MKLRDRETRERLLKAAAQLFADRGFKKVTVREICRAARANVAAVNYHFGDKSGLYREVLQLAIETMRSTNDAARQAGQGLAADARLRHYISVSLCRAMRSGHASWISRLINREMSDPTPTLDAIVDQAFRPRADDLTAIVTEILGCEPDDPRVSQCVTQHSRPVDALRAQSHRLTVSREAAAAHGRRPDARGAHHDVLAGRLPRARRPRQRLDCFSARHRLGRPGRIEG